MWFELLFVSSTAWVFHNTPLKSNMVHNSLEVWKIIFLSKWVICRFHVSLPGCTKDTPSQQMFLMFRGFYQSYADISHQHSHSIHVWHIFTYISQIKLDIPVTWIPWNCVVCLTFQMTSYQAKLRANGKPKSSIKRPNEELTVLR